MRPRRRKGSPATPASHSGDALEKLEAKVDAGFASIGKAIGELVGAKAEKPAPEKKPEGEGEKKEGEKKPEAGA